MDEAKSAGLCRLRSMPRTDERHSKNNRWKSQLEGLRLYSSYQDAVGIDGEAIEFESKDFPRCSSLSVLEEIQKDLARKNNQPEEFKDQIIFMSMFNDIEWKTNDENCISIAEKVKNYAMKLSQGHWSFLGPGSEEKWYGSSTCALSENVIPQPTKWYSDSKKLVTL